MAERTPDETLTSPGLRASLSPITEHELAPGDRVGVYCVIRRLGRGGMGSVYEVEDERTAQRFALKQLRSIEHRERFEREARAAARLEHPNVAALIAVEDAGLVFELAQGSPLSDLLAAQRKLDLDTALIIARQVAVALEAAHEAGIVHRDLKPANIVVGESSRVKIVDFGICKLLDDHHASRLTNTGSVIGTPAYMSPEHAENGARVDAKSDVYSLGVILYEMLAGRAPFEGDPLSILFQHVHKAPPPLPADLPAEVRDLVERSLAKNPADRFQTMKELAAVLGFVAAHDGRRAATRKTRRRAQRLARLNERG